MEPVRGGGKNPSPVCAVPRGSGPLPTSPELILHPSPSRTHLHPAARPLSALKGEREPPAGPGRAAEPPAPGAAPGPSVGALRTPAVPSLDPLPALRCFQQPPEPRQPPSVPSRPRPLSPCPANPGLVLGCPHPQRASAVSPQGEAGLMLGAAGGTLQPAGTGLAAAAGTALGPRCPVPGTARLPQALPPPRWSRSITWCRLPAFKEQLTRFGARRHREGPGEGVRGARAEAAGAGGAGRGGGWGSSHPQRCRHESGSAFNAETGF